MQQQKYFIRLNGIPFHRPTQGLSLAIDIETPVSVISQMWLFIDNPS